MKNNKSRYSYILPIKSYLHYKITWFLWNRWG